jgi:hypothetical protein
MASTVLVTCPQCRAQLRGPSQILGHKVRCKACGTAFKAQAGGSISTGPISKHGNGATSAKIAPKRSATPEPVAAGAGHSSRRDRPAGGQPLPPKEPEPKAPREVSSYNIMVDEAKIQEQIAQQRADTKENPNIMSLGGHEKKAKSYGMQGMKLGQRCPHCAAEMPSEKAIICINCGYNLQTRSHIGTKRTYDTTSQDVFQWRLPGFVAAAVAAVTTIWLFFIFLVAPFAAGENNLSPPWWSFMGGLWFRIYGGLLLGFVTFWCSRFAYGRLILENTPPEIEKR